ncbi:MAG: UMP kinase [Spirochaetaceae bacterium]|jgi:uridylate kinase|nr:UMP kinase [Spirochaetaceae bacterium]
MITVISLGGSIVAPDVIDVCFLSQFTRLIDELLAGDMRQKFIFVVGGGAPARAYQNAFREIADGAQLPIKNIDDEADWLGIMATRLNAQLVKALLAPHCPDPVVIDPTADCSFTGRILVAAGWKPGFSSDNDAVLLAGRFNAKTVINLSNIERVYTADPKIDPGAKPIDAISWQEFRRLVGDSWTPGANVPFDPIASANAQERGIRVICAAGRDLANFKKIIMNETFIGTTIGGGV